MTELHAELEWVVCAYCNGCGYLTYEDGETDYCQFCGGDGGRYEADEPEYGGGDGFRGF